MITADVKVDEIEDWCWTLVQCLGEGMIGHLTPGTVI